MKRDRKAVVRSLVPVLWIGYCACANSYSPAVRSPAELYSASDLVIEARVVQVSGRCSSVGSCGPYRLDLEVVRQYKGNHSTIEGGVLRNACSDAIAELGVTYIFVFESPGDPASSSECVRAVPRDGLFERRAGEVWRIDAPGEQINFSQYGRRFSTNAIHSPEMEDVLRSLGDPHAEAAHGH